MKITTKTKQYDQAYNAAQAGGMNEGECHEFAMDQATRGMKQTTYILSKLDNKTPNQQITQMTWPKRAGWTVVDKWPAHDPPPSTSDARDWQAWGDRTGHQI